MHASNHKEKPKSLKKDSSVKQLKLTTSSSIEFPQLLGKSISQTTLHRKNDENKLRLLEKIGLKKKSS